MTQVNLSSDAMTLEQDEATEAMRSFAAECRASR
jgi:hypothetical protein